MLADFHWIRPEWLLAIPVVVALAVILARRQLGAGHWRAVVDPELMPYVLSRAPGRGVDWRWWLLGFAGVIASAAMAGSGSVLPSAQSLSAARIIANFARTTSIWLSRSTFSRAWASSEAASRSPRPSQT